MADKRSTTSADNGKKGGRPVSEATLRAQIARDYISSEVERNLEPIVTKAIKQAKDGDKYAREWLFDRAHGKSTQPLSGPDGTPLFDNEQKDKAKSAIAGYFGGGKQAGD